MKTSFELEPPVPPKTKVRRYLWALILSGLAVYFFLPHFAAMGHALLVISNLRLQFVALSFGAQLLSYAGSGYLLRTVVKLAAKPISIFEGALITTGANSVGTLGGEALGTAGMTYLWLRHRGVNTGAAGLGSWLPILLNNTASTSGFTPQTCNKWHRLQSCFPWWRVSVYSGEIPGSLKLHADLSGG